MWRSVPSIPKYCYYNSHGLSTPNCQHVFQSYDEEFTSKRIKSFRRRGDLYSRRYSISSALKPTGAGVFILYGETLVTILLKLPRRFKVRTTWSSSLYCNQTGCSNKASTEPTLLGTIGINLIFLFTAPFSYRSMLFHRCCTANRYLPQDVTRWTNSYRALYGMCSCPYFVRTHTLGVLLEYMLRLRVHPAYPRFYVCTTAIGDDKDHE